MILREGVSARVHWHKRASMCAHVDHNVVRHTNLSAPLRRRRGCGTLLAAQATCAYEWRPAPAPGGPPPLSGKVACQAGGRTLGCHGDRIAVHCAQIALALEDADATPSAEVVGAWAVAKGLAVHQPWSLTEYAGSVLLWTCPRAGQDSEVWTSPHARSKPDPWMRPQRLLSNDRRGQPPRSVLQQMKQTHALAESALRKLGFSGDAGFHADCAADESELPACSEPARAPPRAGVPTREGFSLCMTC